MSKQHPIRRRAYREVDGARIEELTSYDYAELEHSLSCAELDKLDDELPYDTIDKLLR